MRRGAIALAVFAALLAGAVSATAGDVTGKDKIGDVKAPNLTKAERDAMDIVSVHAIGEEGLGMMAVVTFRGNIEKTLGRGHLTQGLVAMSLRPKDASHTPAVLATRGTGIDVVFRKTRSEEVGAVRNGRQIMFFINGGGYSTVAGVEIKSVCEPPTRNCPPDGRGTSDAERRGAQEDREVRQPRSGGGSRRCEAARL